MTNPRKLVELPQLCTIIADLRAAGLRVVFTNGCFDIIHPGHILHLQQARQEGDVLVVALDYITIFDTPRVTEIIEAIRPDVYVKGGDYTLDTLVAEEREALERCGTEIRLLPEIGSFSTTDVINRVRNSRDA